jgi:hypothetical protein
VLDHCGPEDAGIDNGLAAAWTTLRLVGADTVLPESLCNSVSAGEIVLREKQHEALETGSEARSNVQVKA